MKIFSSGNRSFCDKFICYFLIINYVYEVIILIIIMIFKTKFMIDLQLIFFINFVKINFLK